LRLLKDHPFFFSINLNIKQIYSLNLAYKEINFMHFNLDLIKLLGTLM